MFSMHTFYFVIYFIFYLFILGVDSLRYNSLDRLKLQFNKFFLNIDTSLASVQLENYHEDIGKT